MLRKILVSVVLCISLVSASSWAVLVLAIPAVIQTISMTPIALTAAAATIGVVTMSQRNNLTQSLSAQLPSPAEQDARGSQIKDNFGFLLKSTTDKKSSTEKCEEKHSSPNCNGTPEECCKDYFKKFDGKFVKHKGGFAVYADKAHKKLLCCLEWDHQHKGLEIFDHRHHHLGERGCDDLRDDPCKWTETRGLHASPNSTTHKPRTPMCQK